MQDPGGSLEKAIQDERAILAPLRDIADRIIDTSQFNAHELRSFLKASFGAHHAATTLNVHVVSFGFKYGVPAEADLLFDVRFIPNRISSTGCGPSTGGTRRCARSWTRARKRRNSSPVSRTSSTS
jgi:UPF0042 nucleotide-binding protein